MDLKNELKYYIENKEHNGAVLLTGNWGCGKTYLVKDMISKNDISEEYIVICISLFGIDSVEKLEKQIKSKIFDLKTNVNLKNYKEKFNAIKKSVSHLSDYFSSLKKINAVLSIDFTDLIKIEKKYYLLQC